MLPRGHRFLYTYIMSVSIVHRIGIDSLHEEQILSIKAILGVRQNIVVNAAAGVGKSIVIRFLSLWFQQKEMANIVLVPQKRLATSHASVIGSDNVATIASWTCNIDGGSSITPNQMFKRKHTARNRKTTPFTIMIDEYTFITSQALQLILACAELVTSGPVYLLMFGDAHQLEPPDSVSLPIFKHSIFSRQQPGQWNHPLRFLTLRDASGRFSNDLYLLRVLTDIRDYGKYVSAFVERFLQLQSNQNIWIRNLTLTRNIPVIVTTRKAVQAINRRFYNQSKGTTESVVIVPYKRNGGIHDAPAVVPLVVGQTVIMVRNYYGPDGVQVDNGTTGVLVSVPEGGTLVASLEVKFVVRLDTGLVTIHCNKCSCGEYKGWTTVPIWMMRAITIHKQQGATMESAILDCSSGDRNFNRREYYVALSRCRHVFDGTSGLIIKNYVPGSIDNFKNMCPYLLAQAQRIDASI